MNSREKKLAVAFGGVLAIGLGAKYLVPGLRNALDARGRVSAARAELEEVLTERDDLENRLHRRYAEYVQRTGSTDPDEIYDVLYTKISNLVTASGATSGASNKPSDPSLDKKTGINYITFNVTANGTMAQCVEFIRSVYRLPYLIRFNTVKFSPTQKQQHPEDDSVKLDAEIEVAILPKEPLLGRPSGNQPEFVDRLKLEPALVSSWRPFNPYIEVVDSGPVVVQQTPDDPPPYVPPSPSGPPEDPNAASQFLRMILSYGVDEVLIEDRARQTTDYVSVGGVLDAGKHVLVHALGAVVHKEDAKNDFGYWVYPLGQSLVQRIRLDEAGQWPEIQVAMLEYLKRQERLREDGDDVGPPAPGDEAPLGGSSGTAEVLPLDGNAATAGATSAMFEEFMGPPALFSARPMIVEPSDAGPRRAAPLVGTTGLGASRPARLDSSTSGFAPVRPGEDDERSLRSRPRSSRSSLRGNGAGADAPSASQPGGAQPVQDRAAAGRSRSPVPRVLRPTPSPAEPAEREDLAAPEDDAAPPEGVPPATDDPVPPE